MPKLISLACPNCGGKVEFNKKYFNVSPDGKHVVFISMNQEVAECEHCHRQVQLQKDQRYNLHPSSFVANVRVRQIGNDNTAGNIVVGGSVHNSNFVIGNNNTVGRKGQCPNCSEPVEASVKFCPECGTRL